MYFFLTSLFVFLCLPPSVLLSLSHSFSPSSHAIVFSLLPISFLLLLSHILLFPSLSFSSLGLEHFFVFVLPSFVVYSLFFFFFPTFCYVSFSVLLFSRALTLLCLHLTILCSLLSLFLLLSHILLCFLLFTRI